MAGIFRFGVFCLALLAIAACDTAEERAEKHFQNAQELLAEGDMQRALVELRNVFSLNAGHKEARLAYAETTRSLGNIGDSYASYLRVAEQFPDDIAVRQTLTEMAILAQNWSEAERHGKVLLAAADGSDAQAIPLLALEFRKAVLDKDAPRIRELTRRAEELAVQSPDSEILSRMLIEGYLAEGEIDKALAIADATIETNPDSYAAYRVKATLLARKQDLAGLEAHLRATIARFSEDQDAKQSLIQLYAQQGAVDDAEDFLRSEIELADDKVAAYVTLLTFMRQSRGVEAALKETEAAIAHYPDVDVLKALKAGMLYDVDSKDEAIALLQSLIDGAEPGDQTDRFRVALAKMLLATGNEVGARQLVEAVLEDDPNQVEALKMSADWLIEADKTDEAIGALRRAMDQAPEDAEAMTLMARAHERAGNPELAQDLIALAVEASGNAPAESLRFARLLVKQERYSGAEDTLIKALRVTPGNLELLELLGKVYLETSDWSRAQGVENALRRIGTEAGNNAAEELKLRILNLREGREKSLLYLEELAEGDDATINAKIALIRTRLADNRKEDAIALAEELARENPDDPRVALALGNTQLSAGALADAEATLRDAAASTDNATIVVQLARALLAQGKSGEAMTAIDDGLNRMTNNPQLMWTKAILLEQLFRIDEAIAIYDDLYETDSNSMVVANNLASLLATYRDNEDSLKRAQVIARRLKGTRVPPFQDTYGWIAFRNGNIDEALDYLVPAAAAMQADPIVQYHLARAYEEAGRKEDALTAYRAALELAGDDDPREQIGDAKTRIETLSAAGQE